MLHSHSFAKRLTGGLLSFLTPLLLVSCGGNNLDLDALNAQALQRQKQVLRADSVAIAKYIADSSFVNVRRQPSGVCIVSRAAGTGDLPRTGQTASVVYKGMLLTNQVFDQSRLGPDGLPVPFIFTLGANQVIPGWEEGIRLMRKGEKAILLIPSAWAYGPSGAGNLIPPDAPLRFDVELTNLQ